MKKKLVGFLLIFTLTATGAAACGTADTNIDANAESSVQEEQVGISEEEKTEEAEEGDASAENQEVNEYGLTDEEWNLLMDKYRANLAEWVQLRLDWEASDQFDPSYETPISDDVTQILGFGEIRLLGAYISAGDDVSEAIDSLLEQGEAADWIGGNWTIEDRTFLPALAEWKAETGIDQERLTGFLTALLENPDSFSETYTKPMLEELIQTAQGV